MENTQQTIVIKNQKSAGVAALLGFFFGPLGMLYATGMGALIMFIITLVIGIVSFGFGLLITNPICAIWAYMSVKKDNEKETIVSTQTQSSNSSTNESVNEDDMFN